MELLQTIGGYAAAVSSIVAAACLLITPLREKLFGLHDIREGQKALLRATMVRIYYAHNETKKLTEYEYNNFILCYTAYKALKGNSFIDKIRKDVENWEIIDMGE